MECKEVRADMIKKKDYVFLGKKPCIVSRIMLSENTEFGEKKYVEIIGTHVFNDTYFDERFRDYMPISRFVPKEETLKLIRVVEDEFHTVDEDGNERKVPILDKEIYNEIISYFYTDNSEMTITVTTVPVLDSDTTVSEVTSWDMED